MIDLKEYPRLYLVFQNRAPRQREIIVIHVIWTPYHVHTALSITILYNISVETGRALYSSNDQEAAEEASFCQQELKFFL